MKIQYYLHTLTFNDHSTQFITSTTMNLNKKDFKYLALINTDLSTITNHKVELGELVNYPAIKK
jgi:hypothetical protein